AEPEDAADVTTGEDPEEETDGGAEAVVTEEPEADVPESDLEEEPEEDAPESGSMEGADADVPVDGSTEEPGSDVRKTVLAEGGDTDGSNM
ncbi:MAG: hypothetical protein IJT32_05145, partial [Lachnospiraceae bacterium]|nr:hypothetical protein [Lachnospiraceae bacterium]